MIRVLIVEDQRMAREDMENYIQSSGRYSLEASITNAAMAETVCKQSRCELVLMDVCTEDDESGLVAAEQIKKTMPQIKIIIVTSLAECSFIERAHKAGVESFWYKDAGKEELLEVMKVYGGQLNFAEIIPCCAFTGENCGEVIASVMKYLPEGPKFYDDDVVTDQPERQVMGELLREKLLLCLDKEIPHGTAVEITKFSERDSGVVDVDATIYCEKASHKGIIIGKQGAMLKKISSLARADMEKFMGTKVYLQTWVKVKENWRDNLNYVRSMGYRDE